MKPQLLGGACCWLVLALVTIPPPIGHATEAADCSGRGADSYAPTAGAIFNDPNGSEADEYRILSTIERNIDHTPPGEAIRIATLRIEVGSIARALIEADDCGVDVRVVVSEGSWNDKLVIDLRRALGSDTDRGSYVTRCDGACLRSGPDGIMHAKMYLFSSTGGVTDVALYGSSNLTEGQAEDRFNDAYQTFESEVFGAARRYFDEFGRPGDIDFPRMTKAPGYRQYFFPQPGNFHLRVLDEIACRTSTGPTSIRLSVSIWESRVVADKLAALHGAGCDVRVVVHRDEADRPVLRVLHRRDVPTHVQSMENGEPATHSKYLTIEGEHRDRQVRTVYCGSLNVNAQSYDSNNSMIRILDDQDVYRAFSQHFHELWRHSRPLHRSDISSAGRLDARMAERRD